MYKSQVFIQFRESYNIKKIITNITQSSEYYKQLDIYILILKHNILLVIIMSICLLESVKYIPCQIY